MRQEVQKALVFSGFTPYKRSDGQVAEWLKALPC